VRGVNVTPVLKRAAPHELKSLPSSTAVARTAQPRPVMLPQTIRARRRQRRSKCRNPFVQCCRVRTPRSQEGGEGRVFRSEASKKAAARSQAKAPPTLSRCIWLPRLHNVVRPYAFAVRITVTRVEFSWYTTFTRWWWWRHTIEVPSRSACSEPREVVTTSTKANRCRCLLQKAAANY